MRDDAHIPSAPSVERLVAARSAHGDSAHTLRALRSDLGDLCAFLAQQGLTPETCDSEPLRRWQAQLGARRLAPATIARRLSSVRALFGDLVRRGERADDPSLVLVGPRSARGAARSRDGRRLRDAARRRLERGRRATCATAPILELLYGCGLRASEVCGLDVASYDAAAGTLRVIGKGDRERLVPVGEPAREALDEWLRDGRPERRRRVGGAAPERARPPALAVGRAPRARAPLARRRHRRPLAARAPARLRYPSVGGRRRAARDPGAARPRFRRDDADLRARRRPAPRARARRPPPPRLMAVETTETTEHVPREELGEIWRQYKASGDRALRDRLILTYAPLVKYVAGKLGSWLPPHVEEGDLISYGLLGLIGAIERFEPDREIKFETYAISRIRGAMIDELRSLDWVPRSVRNRAREIERAMAELENRHKRTPSDEEVAGELGITVGEFEESLTQIARSSVVALDELWSGSGAGGESTALIDTIEDPHASDPSRELLQGEMRQALAQAITRLPDRERLVVTLYYYEELTLREIGEVLSVTESRVSQLHTKAILRLRVRLQGSLDHAA